MGADAYIDAPLPTVSVVVPGAVVSTQNTRRWAHVRATKQLRAHTYITLHNSRELLPLMWHEVAGGVVAVLMTRIYSGRQRVYGFDTLVYSLKAVRDGVADYLWRRCPKCANIPCGHVHDDDERMTWNYAQRRGEKPGVLVEVWT